MNLPDIIYENSEITDRETFGLMPMDLKEFYLEHNGIVAFQGGIQFRGCLKSPTNLSIQEIWKGDSNLFKTGFSACARAALHKIKTFSLLNLTEILFNNPLKSGMASSHCVVGRTHSRILILISWPSFRSLVCK